LDRLLAGLEASALGEAIRAAGVWSYGIINAAHILGIATLFGAILVLDLRLILRPRAPALAAIAQASYPVAGVGLALALLTGVCLLATNGSEYQDNPFLLLKFAAILVGVANLAVLHRLPAWRRLQGGGADGVRPATLRLCGALSLLSWMTAIVAGRMMGYW
jgi:hypothetical protein